MAEAAGLALGGIALVSLFKTCAETFECIEDARNITSDVKLATTKIYLLKLRLYQWGQTLAVDRPGEEAEMLRRRWPDSSNAIMDGLAQIRELLETALILGGRYRCSENMTWCGSTTMGPALLFYHALPLERSDPDAPVAKPPFIKKQLSNIGTRRRSFISFSMRFKWAIHDKKRFHCLITDLDFLITSLEELGEGISEKETQSLPTMPSEHHSSNQSRSNQSPSKTASSASETSLSLNSVLGSKNPNLSESGRSSKTLMSSNASLPTENAPVGRPKHNQAETSGKTPIPADDTCSPSGSSVHSIREMLQTFESTSTATGSVPAFSKSQHNYTNIKFNGSVSFLGNASENGQGHNYSKVEYEQSSVVFGNTTPDVHKELIQKGAGESKEKKTEG
ncbi:prion-inhibition and propagation-domain-containing protein [Whalleya microplaca]|nr:prion-inhibition and propagation-domain-containing protein [Whalleya microplaca]